MAHKRSSCTGRAHKPHSKHEHEELKEGTWLEPALALLRKEAKGNWTVKHRNAAVGDLAGRWLDAKETVRYWLVGCKSNVKPASWRKVQKKHRLYHCPEWHEVRREIPRKGGSGKGESSRILSVKANGIEVTSA